MPVATLRLAGRDDTAVQIHPEPTPVASSPGCAPVMPAACYDEVTAATCARATSHDGPAGRLDACAVWSQDAAATRRAVRP